MEIQNKRLKRLDFTYEAQNMLKKAAIALEKLGKENILIVTLTHPGSTRKALSLLEQESDSVVNKFNEYLRRNLEKPEYMWVYEYQKRGALHLHYAIYIPPSSGYEVLTRFTQEAIQNRWFGILQDLSKKSGVDIFERIDGVVPLQCDPSIVRVEVERCYSSVQKYFSKSNSKMPYRHSDGTVSAPKCWSRISKSLRKRLRREQLTRIFEVDDQLFAATLIQHALCLMNPSKFGSITNKYWKVWSGYWFEVPVSRIQYLQTVLSELAKKTKEEVERNRKLNRGTKRSPGARRPVRHKVTFQLESTGKGQLKFYDKRRTSNKKK
ncbi:MAG: helitron helicase-like domain-containing protein [Candidatus Obscuribacterales bacterium]|nr:helitron helicase-like domain-containing protein [Candidatus Obscuribacterales bacterium]